MLPWLGTGLVYEMVQNKAGYYRQKAAEARQAAQQMRHPECRDQLIEIAEAFENLAARLDARDLNLATAVNQQWTA